MQTIIAEARQKSEAGAGVKKVFEVESWLVKASSLRPYRRTGRRHDGGP